MTLVAQGERPAVTTAVAAFSRPAATMTFMAPSRPRAIKHAPRTAPRIRRGTAPKLLLAAARELFAEQGPRATTTRQIAERAKVSEDLIFRYYGSKNGLLREAVIRPIVDLLESLRPDWVADHEAALGDDHDRSVAVVGQLFDAVHGNRTVVLTMLQVLTGGPGEMNDPEVRALANQMYEPMEPAFRHYLARNGFRDTDPALMLRLIMILIGASAAYIPGTYLNGDPVPQRDRIVDELVNFIHYGLRRPE